MTIRFKCPNCQKPLSVKDHLAGKQAACPVCKKAIAIPTPVAAPVDVDALVAEALADKPVEKPAEPTTFIDFTCPFCDEELKLSADLAGKKTPCPKCTNIIKVPLLQVAKPKDWRANQSTGPSGARMSQQDQPDDAWTTAQKTRVSQRAMEEAGALPDERIPIGIGGWIRRCVWAGALLGVIAFVFTMINRTQETKREQNHLEEAKKYLDKLAALPQGEFYRSAGEIAVRNRKLIDAQTNFTVAQSILANAPKSIDRDWLLGQLALAQAEMGGTDDEALGGLERVSWKDGRVQDDMRRTLEAIGSVEAKASALRAVAGLMRDKNQPDVAIGLTVYLANASERLTAQQVGLQLARAEGGAAIPYSAPGERFAAPDAGQSIDDTAVRVAYTEGSAYKGNYGEALRFASAKGPAAGRLEACIAGADIALADAKNKNASENALPFIKEALAAFRDYSKESAGQTPEWLALELIRLGARTDSLADVKDLVEKLPTAARPRAQLYLLQAKLAKSKVAEPNSLVDDIGEPKDVARALAWEALARHNARLGNSANSDGALAEVDETLKAFIHLGIALGDQDRKR